MGPFSRLIIQWASSVSVVNSAAGESGATASCHRQTCAGLWAAGAWSSFPSECAAVPSLLPVSHIFVHVDTDWFIHGQDIYYWVDWNSVAYYLFLSREKRFYDIFKCLFFFCLCVLQCWNKNYTLSFIQMSKRSGSCQAECSWSFNCYSIFLQYLVFIVFPHHLLKAVTWVAYCNLI